MSHRIKYCVILLHLLIYTICAAEQFYTVSPSKITVETPVTITFLLKTSIKIIDTVTFDVSDGISISEYKIIPQNEGIFFTVKLIPHIAGKHLLQSVTIKSGVAKYTFNIGAIVIVEGVITIVGKWIGPEKAYQFEPFFLVLSIPKNVNENVYKHFANEINKYYEAVFISPNKYLIIASSQLELPSFQLELTDEYTNNAVRFHIVTEPFTVTIVDLPLGTGWVANESNVQYRLQTKKTVYASNEPIEIDVAIQGTGIPIHLQTKSLRIFGSNGYNENLEIPLRTHYTLEQGTIQSKLDGSGVIILNKCGSYKIITEPIVVFNVKTGKQQVMHGKEIEIAIKEDVKESSYLQNTLLQELSLLCDDIQHLNNSTNSEELNRLKKEHYAWWSKAYACRIAFAMIAQDIAYASYQIVEAQRNGIPLLLQAKYPILYQSLIFRMPAPYYFFILFCICGLLLTVVIQLQKHKPKASSFLKTVLVGIMFLLIVLLGIAIYERIPHYGITDSTPLYKVPDVTATTIAMCSTGSIIKILTASPAWSYVEFEGKRGWVQTQAIVYGVK